MRGATAIGNESIGGEVTLQGALAPELGNAAPPRCLSDSVRFTGPRATLDRARLPVAG